MKETRLQFNISQVDFASSLGISVKHLNRIENCNQYPSFPLLFEMLSKLSLKMDVKFQLLTDKELKSLN